MVKILLNTFSTAVFKEVLNELEGSIKTQLHDRGENIEVVFEEPDAAAELFATYEGEYKNFTNSIIEGIEKLKNK